MKKYLWKYQEKYPIVHSSCDPFNVKYLNLNSVLTFMYWISLECQPKNILLSYKTRQMDKTQVVNLWSLLQYIETSAMTIYYKYR